jgi:hypothetical protein
LARKKRHRIAFSLPLRHRCVATQKIYLKCIFMSTGAFGLPPRSDTPAWKLRRPRSALLWKPFLSIGATCDESGVSFTGGRIEAGTAGCFCRSSRSPPGPRTSSPCLTSRICSQLAIHSCQPDGAARAVGEADGRQLGYRDYVAG